MRDYFFLNKVVVYQSNKKQRKVSTSITKVEYIALKYIAREVVQIQLFIIQLKLDIVPEIEFFRNNKMRITLIKNIESQH